MTTTNKIILDNVPLNKFHIRIAGITLGAHFTDGYAIGIIGFALTLIAPQLDLTPFWQGLIGSSALLGLFLGSMFFGWLADVIGRKLVFTISFIVITIASALQFFAETAMTLFLLRIIIGIGLGGDFSVGHALLSEYSPKKHRGILLSSFSVIWTIGYVSASFVGYWFSKNMSPDIAWQWMLASSAIPAGLIMIARIGTPESARWLMQKGRKKEADLILLKHFGDNVIIDDVVSAEKSARFATLFGKEYIKRTLFNCIFFACIVMPYFAIYTFLPQILSVMGLSQNSTTDLLLNVFLIVGAIFGIYLTHKCSRRGFLINSFIVLVISLLALALFPSSLAVLSILAFSIFTLTLSAVSNLVGVFPAESFPTEIRATGVGLAISFSRIASAISTFLLPVALLNIGTQNTLLALVAILIVGLIVSILWAPETKDKTLSEAGSSN